MAQIPPEEPGLPTELLGNLSRIIDKLKNEFLLVTLAIFILVITIGVLAPDVVDSLGREFFFLLVVLAWLAYIIGRVLNTWLQIRTQAPSQAVAPITEPAQPTAEPAPETPPAGDHDSVDLHELYLRHLLLVSNELRLTAIDRKAATRPETAELELSEVFTTLDVIGSTEQPDEQARRLEREIRTGRDADRQSAISALAEHPHLVLLGEPGSGKTTLVRFLSVCLAGDGLGLADLNVRRLGEEWNLPRLVPVRVVLRDYAARGLPNGLGLWAFVAAELQRTAIDESGSLAPFAPQLRARLERDGGLLLLDGLDEVPDAHHQREQLKTAVERFAIDFPRCRVLVTSRPYAYENPAWHLTGFSVRRLADFDAEQIQEFIAKWYGHIAVRDPAFDEKDAERYAAQLQNAVQTNPRLAELAPRPLLMTLMASLHRWRHGGALPDKREELYDESVKLLIDLWQRPKLLFDAQGNPAGAEYNVWTELHISSANLRKALEKVAFEAHRDQPTTTGTHDIAVDTLAGALYQASDKRESLSIESVCDYVRDRTGLLIDRGADVFAFPHRTFQEYLAACYLTDYRFPRELAGLCRKDDERWREAVLLAAAKAARGTSDSVWRLAEALCPRRVDQVPEPGDADWYAALRATQSLVETEQHHHVEEWDLGKLERLRGWLMALLESGALPPPERAAAGRALARLPAPAGHTAAGGDLRAGVGVDTATGLPDIVWCPVPAGKFVMGEGAQEHTVELPAYGISRHPVTNAQFQAFVEDGGYRAAGYWREAEQAGWWTEHGLKSRSDNQPRSQPVNFGNRFNLPNQPVVGVSWYEAVAFCRWLTEKQLGVGGGWRVWSEGEIKELDVLVDAEAALLGHATQSTQHIVRLPTEAEWEKAARGTDGRKYPWGNAFDVEKCNVAESGIGATSTVGIFPAGASSDGVMDLSGNVWEWCATRSQDDYPLPRVNEWSAKYLGSDMRRVLRGGSWYINRNIARCADRGGYDPDFRYVIRGFRCVVASTSSLPE